MPSHRFHRIVEAFHAARILSPEERETYFQDNLGDDAELRKEVESLLAAESDTAEFMEPPAGMRATCGLLEDVPSPSLVGKEVGSYTLTRLIASGGMGAVYVAVQDHPRREVAVKVMKAGLTSRDALRRFQYEADVLARLRHPGIAQVYEAGTFDGGTGPVPFFAMELVPDALDLVEYAETNNLTVPERLNLFNQVCEAVHHGHQKGIIHRDLKPANILVDSTGRPRVIDFGVARATDTDRVATTLLTRAGQFIGTLQYMSPEQWKADPGDLDTRSDVYALGTVLFELLSGEVPYDLSRAAIHEAARIVMENPPKKPSTIVASLGGDLETIILKAMEKDRRRRYSSAADLRRDLTRFLNHQPIEAHPPSLGYQVRMFARRNRAAFIALAATFLILAAATVLSTLFALQANRARNSEAERARKETAAHARADRLFDKGRSLARWVIFEFLYDLQKLSGATHAEEKLSRHILKYLDALSEEDATDPALQRELAVAYQMVAYVQGGQRQHSLGDTEGALDSFRKAQSIYRRLEASKQADLDDMRNHANLIREIGNIHALKGNKKAAMKMYETAETRFRAHLEKAPDRTRIQIGLAGCYQDMGTLQKESGHLDLAMKTYLKMLPLLEAALSARPDDDLSRRMNASAHALLAELHDARGDHDAARASYGRFMKFAEVGTGKKPTDLRALRDLSIACIAAGDLYIRTNENDRALRSFRKALEIREALVAANPGDSQARVDLSVSHQRIGSLTQMMGDLPGALLHARKSLEIVKKLVVVDPKNVWLRHSLWISYDLTASILLASGDLEEALSNINKTLETAGALVRQDPSNLVHHQGVAQAYLNLGNYHILKPDRTSSTGTYISEFRKARAMYEKSRRALIEIETAAELTADQKNLAAILEKKLKAVEDSIRKLEEMK